ncbi:MAG: efflux transporter outer membrane subunit, partial [Muribaculaceae bacterium]|nr:efflux transporter outer membrane subunit [Muribaculaceae bacterium]
MTKSKIASALSAIILLPSSQYAVAEELNDVKSEITTPIVMTEVTGTGDVRQEVEITADDEIDSHWWKRFGDELLDSIITLATERNYDIAIASRRIEIARQAVASARGNYYPQIDINAGWAANRESGAIEGKHVPASKNSYWNGGATMNWEIDLFGKIRAQVKQSNSQLRLSKAEFGAALIAMQAQLATAYVNLRVYQAEMQVAMEHSESQLKVVHITEARHKAGLASMLDVAQAKTVYYSTKASIPQLETSIRGMINSIAILLAENPTDIYPLLRVPTTSLDHTQIVAKSISLDLINRRPDIVAARQKVATAADALGIAKKDYLPTLSVTGSIGVSTHNLSDAFARNSYVYSVAPTLSWTLF